MVIKEFLQNTDFNVEDTNTIAVTSDDTVASSIALNTNESKKNLDESKSDDLVTTLSVATMPFAISTENLSKSNDCNKNAKDLRLSCLQLRMQVLVRTVGVLFKMVIKYLLHLFSMIIANLSSQCCIILMWSLIESWNVVPLHSLHCV